MLVKEKSPSAVAAAPEGNSDIQMSNSEVNPMSTSVTPQQSTPDRVHATIEFNRACLQRRSAAAQRLEPLQHLPGDVRDPLFDNGAALRRRAADVVYRMCIGEPVPIDESREAWGTFNNPGIKQFIEDYARAQEAMN